MRRARITALVAVLALLMLPSGATARPLGTLDQNVTPGEGTSYLADWNVTQRFTAHLTGKLTYVELFCFPDAGGDAVATLTVGDSAAIGTCTGDTGDWTPFVFGAQPAAAGRPNADPTSGPFVVAGHAYTIVFGSTTPIHWGVAAADYTGGAAARGGQPIQDVSDFAFRTYVDTQLTPPPTSVASSTSAPEGSAGWLITAIALAFAAVVVVRRRVLAPKR